MWTSLLRNTATRSASWAALRTQDVDKEDWTDEACEKEVRRVCETYGMKHFIPCIAQGGPGSVYPGVYQSLTNAIDKLNKEKFGMKILNPHVCRSISCSDIRIFWKERCCRIND